MAKNQFSALWKQYEPLICALTELLHPFIEVALHDLKKGTIVALYNCLSKRKVGDRSPLSELQVATDNFPDYFPSYYKENYDGKALKCTSITLRDENKKPVGLICMNIDVSFFQESMQLIKSFLQVKEEAKNPVERYGASCEKQAQALMQEYAQKHKLSILRLSRTQKRELVQELFKKGLFNYKNAAPYIAKKLQLSRASIYNYLKVANAVQ